MSDDAITLHSDIELPSFLLKAGEAISRGGHYFRDVLESLVAVECQPCSPVPTR